MIGRIVTLTVLLAINCAIQVYGWFFFTGLLDAESISEKIGCVCAMLSLSFPVAIAFVIIKELIQGGLL